MSYLSLAGVQAQASYHVTLPTSVLNTRAVSGPFSIDLQFTNGSGKIDTNNMVSVAASLSGGSAMGTPTLVGGANGSLPMGVMLTDSSFFNEFTQKFTPGSSPGSALSFDIMLSTSVDMGAPDELAFALLDGMGKTVSTTDPTGAGAFFTIDLNSSTNPKVTTYTGAGGYVGLIPTILRVGSNVPGVKVSADGSIAVTGGRANFHLSVQNTAAGPLAVLWFSDTLHHVVIGAKSISGVVVTGTHVQVLGKAYVNNAGSFDLAINADTQANTFQIALSTGYAASGVVNGKVLIN